MSFSSDEALQSNQLPISFEFPLEQDEFRNTVDNTYKRIANSVNTKVGGLYPLQEIAAFKQYYTANDPFVFRNVYRKIFSFGAIAAGATLLIPHGITTFTEMTVIEGHCITDIIDYRPIPYVSNANVNQQISIRVTSTDIVIVNGSGAPNITQGTAILEYVKN